MGIPGSANPMLLAGAAGAYEINQSLRFNSADSAYLNRTPASAGNRKTWTFSCWAKRGKNDNYYTFGMSANSSGTDYAAAGIWGYSTEQDTIILGLDPNSATARLKTSAVYRDYSGWYHIVVAWDTTQATASNRIKLYVNGVQQTALATANYPSQNFDGLINNTHVHYIGKAWSGDATNDGYLAEVNFIDGTALDPSSFGETDTITGAWIPKKYSGSYGTNGFYLKFESSGIGTDSSGNGNTWTANNFSTSGTGTDVMSDTPTTNWCTWNPINKGSSAGSYGSQLSDGNLVLAYNKTAGDFYATSTFGLPTTGKWYWEQRLTSAGSLFAVMGIAELNWTWNVSPRVSYFSSGKIVISPDSSSDAQTGLSTYTTGDVIGHAWDADAGTLQFYKNGTAVGNPQAPTTTTNITFAIAFNAGSDTGWTTVLNCGQRAFEQTPPTGYKALNTANLPEPTIKDGGKYFNTVLYTGNGGTQAVTGVGFQPDMTWIKRRNASAEHWINDAVRGAGYSLPPSNTLAEQNYTTLFTSFDSDGFSLASGTSSFNESASTYVAWNWDAGGTGSSNNAGSITSTVSANLDAGFSIATYTGNGTAGATIGHGLGVAPSFIVTKRRDNTSVWNVYHASLGATKVLYLNQTSSQQTDSSVWNNTAPSSTVFTVGTDSNINTNTGTFVAYCFSEVAGYSKFGSYTGNGSSDGPFVFCGFRPRWLMIKCTNTTGDWFVYDTARDTENVSYKWLKPNSSGTEPTGGGDLWDILSNGFKVRNNNANQNGSSNTYIFAAFAELPFKYSTAR